MIDVLFLLADSPLKTPDGKYFNNLYRIADKKLRGYNWKCTHVVDHYMEKIKKQDIEANLGSLMEFIEIEHPKVIIAMGREAYMSLGLESKKIIDNCNIPTRSPYLGTGICFRRKRSNTEIHDSRGAYYIKSGEYVRLVSHKDIWIYPTHSYKNMLTYGCGYKGQDFFERQLERVVEIVDEYPNFKKFQEEDLGKSVTLFYKPEHLKDAYEKLAELEKLQVFAFDIETAGYDVPKEAQLEFSHRCAKITMISIGTSEHSYVFNTYRLPCLKYAINKVLANNGKHLTWNGRFDIEFLKYLWKTNFREHVHIDGRICLYLVDMQMQFLGKGSSTLKFASAIFMKNGAKFAGYEKNDGIHKAIEEGDGAYLEAHEVQFMYYCGIDVLVTDATVKTLWKLMDSKNRSLATSYYMNLSEMLNEIHSGGIMVDEEKLERYINDLREFIAAIEINIKSIHDINPKSTQDLAKVLYEIRGLTRNYTERGNLSVTTEILESYKDDPFCRLVLDYRGFLKQLEIFEAIKKYVKNGYCKPTYNQYRTTSGRLSSTNPPIQIVPTNKKIISEIPEIDQSTGALIGEVISLNRPVWKYHVIVKDKVDLKYKLVETSPNFKEIFIPEPGHTLIYSDYSQLEVNILANYINRCSLDKTLQNAIIQGRDMHSYTCSLLYSVLMGQTFTEEFITQNKEVEPYSSWRQASKAILFKLIYGGTYKSFAVERNIPEEEAKRIFDTFTTVIPGIADYMNNQEIMAKTYYNVDTLPGHVRSLKVYQFERYNSKARSIALNHPIQGTACYFVNIAMMKLHERLPEINGRILLTVHDSIASQVPDDKLEEGLALQKWCKIDYLMEKYKEFFYAPLRMSLYYGKNWHELTKKKF